MSRYRGPRLRVIRRFGELPGLTRKVPKNTKSPGQHGKEAIANQRLSFSDYKIRLFEKQKLRYNFGLTERQLLNYVKQAQRKKGATGFLLVQALEMRLDTILFRMGIAPTIPASRQFVNHGHVLVNGQRVDIPSFQCQPNDVITFKTKKGTKDLIEQSLKSPRFSSLPDHLTFDSKTSKGNVLDLVDRKNLSFKINELLIVEYYSRIL